MSERTDALRRALSDGARRGRLAILGHDGPDFDALASCTLLRDLCASWGIEAEIVLPTRADEQARRMLPRFGLNPERWRGETSPEDALALVDHHATQRPGRVAACIDHHPTEHPPACPFALIEPSGACASILLRLMCEAGMTPSREQEALAVAALYLDTIALRSTKITPGEAAWARAGAKRLGLDEARLNEEGMHLQDMRLPPEKLAMLGKKAYLFGGRRVLSSYVQTNAMTPDTLDAILGVLRAAVRAESAALWVFLVHDPEAGRSTEYDVAADASVTRIGYDRLISRGSDVMPRVERALTAQSAGEGDAHG